MKKRPILDVIKNSIERAVIIWQAWPQVSLEGDALFYQEQRDKQKSLVVLSLLVGVIKDLQEEFRYVSKAKMLDLVTQRYWYAVCIRM